MVLFLLAVFYFRLPRTMALLSAAFRAYLPTFHVLSDHPGSLMVWCLSRCNYLINCEKIELFFSLHRVGAVEIVGFW